MFTKYRVSPLRILSHICFRRSCQTNHLYVITGPQKQTQISWETYLKQNEISTPLDKILQKRTAQQLDKLVSLKYMNLIALRLSILRAVLGLLIKFSGAQEMQATSFHPPVVHEMPKDLSSPASSQAQASEADPQDVPKGGAPPRLQTRVAHPADTSKAITHKTHPSSLSQDAQSLDLATGSSRPSRLDILHTRIDKVRGEKERLARLQELDYLEAELQREIMDEQRKELGTG